MDISKTPSTPTTLIFYVFFWIVYFKNSGNNIRSMLAHRLRRWPNIG